MKNFKKILVLIFSILMFNLISIEVSAQCAMCRSVTESNLKNDPDKVGSGLNTGILYLMSFPYILAAIGGFIWYTHKKKTVTNN